MTDLDVINAIIEKTAMETAKKVVYEQRAEHEGRCKRRLRNTKLLLKNYQNFKAHCTGAVFTDDQDGSKEESVIEILDMMMQRSSGTAVVESIRMSCRRTKIIMEHIDAMLKMFETYCAMQKNSSVSRGYKILRAIYIDGSGKTIEEAAEDVGVSVRQAYRDRDEAIDKLSVYMFGVDALDNM